MTQSHRQLEELHNYYTRTAANIITYYEDDERRKKLKELRDIVQEHCSQYEKLKSAQDIKIHAFSLCDNNNDNEKIDMESIINGYDRGISEINVDVTRHPRLLEFDKHVEALLDNAKGSRSDQDAELELSGGYINVIDPISKKRIVDPVKNSICGHTYDRESITEMLKINKNTRCPVVGCKSKEFVRLTHLRADIVTKTYLEKNS
ncbi:E3 SUMO-protein ligase NSE2-like [Ceratina calcarata]|uniref:E3 SUMO-protein ligase NSE2 n=1 Tax=Ceratina calcarata TaxID=156304 RepID=A0AAJ7JII1_9HYME|nr:E3 SUMO-protein ligase NSE2-like [Ceratina calcarata]